MEKRVSKARFKAAALEYLRDVEASGEALVITDRGRPVLRVAPIEPATATLARLRGCVLRYDLPAEPVSAEAWEALA
jgi:antitoxin (DNA-binding transcriptional repressor) of toxin-antitoxin stability system